MLLKQKGERSLRNGVLLLVLVVASFLFTLAINIYMMVQA